MSQLAQIKQWILSVVVGRFRYKYACYSPFGECWIVYRLWFGFIPIEYCEKVYDDMLETTLIAEYVTGLNAL